MNEKIYKRIGIILGLIVGLWLFMVAPMLNNYKTNGCVFGLECIVESESE